MLSPQQITDTARRLAAQLTQPAKIILFGSCARGEADDAFDLDLMIVEGVGALSVNANMATA